MSRYPADLVEWPSRARPVLLTPTAELRRLDAHFVRVLGSLRARTPRSLSAAQRRARKEHLTLLEAYRRHQRFPKNRRFPTRRLPHFIDESGTRCAMGFLIEASGAHDLVQYVARERNYARIRELANIPELCSWLEANGLTVGEAGMIQPEYCGTPAQNCFCGDAFAQGMLQGTLGEGGASLLVTAVYGPVTGVEAGDVVPLSDPSAAAAPTDIIFARFAAGSGTAYLQFVAPASANGEEPSVVVPTSACWFPQVASIPGPIPLSVAEQALSASDSVACESVLAEYDAKWGEMQGGCIGAAGGSGGTSASGGSGAALGGTSSSTGGSGVGGDRPDANVQARSDSDGGCAVAHGAMGAEAALAISGALALYHARRSVRRR